MKPYSPDLREKIIRALEAGETQEGTADRFSVSLSFVEKLWRRWRETGSCAALPPAGDRHRSLREHEAALRKQVAEQPDVTLSELCDRMSAAGAPAVSLATMCAELRRLDLPRKRKSLHHSERDTERVQGLREGWREAAADFLAGRLKFLDEMGSNLALTRLYGRAAPGERINEGVPQNRGENVTTLAAIDTGGVPAPMTVNGAVDGTVFLSYVREVLCPTLAEGDIVVMDNLRAHKVAGVREAIEARGARSEYLPPYSPDFNPIEKCWSKVKTYLRRVKARTREALEAALKEALATVTQADALAWFVHCGYPVH